MERDEVTARLDEFPPESDRAFEAAAVDLMMSRGATRVDLEHILGDAEAPIERRYAALFSLGTFFRRATVPYGTDRPAKPLTNLPRQPAIAVGRARK